MTARNVDIELPVTRMRCQGVQFEEVEAVAGTDAEQLGPDFASHNGRDVVTDGLLEERLVGTVEQMADQKGSGQLKF